LIVASGASSIKAAALEVMMNFMGTGLSLARQESYDRVQRKQETHVIGLESKKN